jgi:hypothetical protein
MAQEAEHERVDRAAVDRVQGQVPTGDIEREIVGESPAGRVDMQVVSDAGEESGLQPDPG